MDRLGYERYDAEFEAVTAEFGEAASACAPDDRVPTCPEWTVRDLATHVGTGHRWAAGIIERRVQQPVPQTPEPAPTDTGQWPQWLEDGARRLRDAIRAGGPALPVWTWQADKTAGFWLRRMLHDGLVHRFDAQAAGGRLGEVDASLAADGVTDLLDCVATLTLPQFQQRSGFGKLAGDGQTLLFQAIDVCDWLVKRTADGVTWRHATGPADVTVRASARDLLLVLNRRLDLAEAQAETAGDTALFLEWLENGRF